MSGSVTRPARFFRRDKPANRICKVRIRMTDEEHASLEAEAASFGMGLEDYVAMRLLMGMLEVQGNA